MSHSLCGLHCLHLERGVNHVFQNTIRNCKIRLWGAWEGSISRSNCLLASEGNTTGLTAQGGVWLPRKSHPSSLTRLPPCLDIYFQQSMRAPLSPWESTRIPFVLSTVETLGGTMWA